MRGAILEGKVSWEGMGEGVPCNPPALRTETQGRREVGDFVGIGCEIQGFRWMACTPRLPRVVFSLIEKHEKFRAVTHCLRDHS